jgi:ABC-type uncharacterized transport system auxiliary subunit
MNSGKQRAPIMLALLVLLCGGCGGPYYFDLQTEVVEARGAPAIDRVLLIDRVDISEVCRDVRVVSRVSPFLVRYSACSFWARPPEDLIADAAASFWTRRATFRRVLLYGDDGESDWTMKMWVEAFEKRLVEGKWHARLAMQVEMRDSRGDRLYLRHAFDRQVPLEGKKDRLLPEAISRILTEELLKIEARLGATPEPGAPRK